VYRDNAILGLSGLLSNKGTKKAESILYIQTIWMSGNSYTRHVKGNHSLLVIVTQGFVFSIYLFLCTSLLSCLGVLFKMSWIYISLSNFVNNKQLTYNLNLSILYGMSIIFYLSLFTVLHFLEVLTIYSAIVHMLFIVTVICFTVSCICRNM